MRSLSELSVQKYELEKQVNELSLNAEYLLSVVERYALLCCKYFVEADACSARTVRWRKLRLREKMRNVSGCYKARGDFLVESGDGMGVKDPQAGTAVCKLLIDTFN
jgi:hypothetical protein